MKKRLKKLTIWVLAILMAIALFAAFHTSVSSVNLVSLFNYRQTEDKITFSGHYSAFCDFYAKHKITYQDNAAYVTLYHYTFPLFTGHRSGIFDIEIDCSSHKVENVYLINEQEIKKVTDQLTSNPV